MNSSCSDGRIRLAFMRGIAGCGELFEVELEAAAAAAAAAVNCSIDKICFKISAWTV